MDNSKLNNSEFIHLKDFLESQDSFLSVIDLDNSYLQLTPAFFDNKTHIKFEHSIFKESNLNTLEIIYETNSNFYIYLSKNNVLDSYYNIKILFHNNKKDEVMFFIRSLNKKLK